METLNCWHEPNQKKNNHKIKRKKREAMLPFARLLLFRNLSTISPIQSICINKLRSIKIAFVNWFPCMSFLSVWERAGDRPKWRGSLKIGEKREFWFIVCVFVCMCVWCCHFNDSCVQIAIEKILVKFQYSSLFIRSFYYLFCSLAYTSIV